MKAMIAALLGVLMATSAQAASKSFQDWTVVCDNTRECSAFGFAEEGADDRPFLHVQRPAAAGAAPVARLVLASESGAPTRWAVRVDGKPVAGLAPKAEGDADVVLTPSQTAALLGAIRNGKRLTLAPGRSDILLTGAAAALRWMDDQQQRAGTLTALVAKGPGPASAVPAPPPVPLVRPGPAVSQSNLPEKLWPGMRAKLGEDCDASLSAEDYDPIIARLSPGVILYGELCYRGAYNEIYGFLLADEKGGHVRLAQIPNLDGATTHLLMNVGFDPETQTLSNFEKGRGIADCGGAYSWVWDGKAFRISDQLEMPACRGLGADEWPQLFRSRPR
ncbi:DUF1176 domain-containing protein [Phenylobacterium sp. 20VBR1]|uniref:DUF1176 domain-containing protein n=1 Tax=Phenylobacterium glaciei TaxID=2803784 RepID=A0A941HWW4_9CAUL|nr:DUF1176 domain-containing protein [Phenylobacterium glaciei]MBR7620476.1 DUF1176 domain-containing protein [Phenylobacterium glaciei]